MTPDTETVRVQLTYPLQRVREPILYHLVADFGLVPNIRSASFDLASGGFIYLELSGARAALRRALAWLDEQGIGVSAIGLDGTQEWAI